MTKIERKIYTIDAEGKVLGRLASKIALLLSGKGKPDWVPYLDRGASVLVKNAAKLKFTGEKIKQKKYYHYSGYPGGLKTKKISEMFAQNPAEVLRRAVYNMLPKNKLRKERMKRLKIL